MAFRPIPQEGARVTVAHLAVRLGATIVAVDDGGRRVRVATDEGEEMVFLLRPATGTFTREGLQSGPRLLLAAPGDGSDPLSAPGG